MKDKKRFKEGYLVKGRNEPCRIVEVCEAVAAIKEMDVEDLAQLAYENSCKLFARGWKGNETEDSD
jgi:TatD DNase family protein